MMTWTRMLGSAALIGAASLLTLTSTATTASAARCTTQASCARTLACPAGWARKVSGKKGYCMKTSGSQTHTPTCKKLNMRNDWKWSSGSKKCVRKNGSRTVESTANISCKSGFKYSNGLCRKPAGTSFARPTAAKGTVGGAIAATCTSSGACTRTLSCGGGYATMAMGSVYYCKTSEKRAPTCAKANMKNDWKWAASKRQCYRRKGKVTVYETKNIRCLSGYIFNKSTGFCHRSPLYAAPTAR